MYRQLNETSSRTWNPNIAAGLAAREHAALGYVGHLRRYPGETTEAQAGGSRPLPDSNGYQPLVRRPESRYSINASWGEHSERQCRPEIHSVVTSGGGYDQRVSEAVLLAKRSRTSRYLLLGR